MIIKYLTLDLELKTPYSEVEKYLYRYIWFYMPMSNISYYVPIAYLFRIINT